jgi:hypothetical protein
VEKEGSDVELVEFALQLAMARHAFVESRSEPLDDGRDQQVEQADE